MINLILKENSKPDFIVGSFKDEEHADKWIERAKLAEGVVAEKIVVPETDMVEAESIKEAALVKPRAAKKFLKEMKKGDLQSFDDVERAFEKLFDILGLK